MPEKVIILGTGVAGLTAAIYTARATLQPLVVEGPIPGGQLSLTSDVENWPGELLIQGPELMKKMRAQAEACGARIMPGSVTRVDFGHLETVRPECFAKQNVSQGNPFKLWLDDGKQLEAQSVIIATGAANRKLNVPGEDQYFGKGVSICATCDGPFHKGKSVVVVGGGDSAMIEAYFLSKLCAQVTIIHLRDKLTGLDPIKFKVQAAPNVTIIYSATTLEIKGDGQRVSAVRIKLQSSGTEQEIPCSGVFVAIGLEPCVGPFKDAVGTTERGYLRANPNTTTQIPGIFVAGDVSDFEYRQAITAGGEGCKAALECQEYLDRLPVQR